jgi:Concanavalin A-like lectin/glucanases superfamily
MPGSTSRLALPYPTPTDSVDVPRDVQALANNLDPKASIFAQGTAAARPAAGIAGRFYYATDTGVLSYDSGTDWIASGAGGGESSVLTQAAVLDVGMANQVRAGHQLAVADFTALGLSAPLGLWNLSDVNDSSGSGRNLTNKGGVPFGVGINGLAATAAVFAGSTGQALYIADTGAADPFRIRTGSWGCWLRTAKRGTTQVALSKWGGTVATSLFNVFVSSANVVAAQVGDGTTTYAGAGVSDVADDRWHFALVTHDGTALRLYVDGMLEASVSAAVIVNGAAPINVGGQAADASTANGAPFYGRVDEAFVTADVLSEDQVRALYCVKLAHGYAGTPMRVSLNVRRRRRGGALAVADFPTQPLRLHNFTGGSLGDEGSGGVALVNNGGALSVAAADGALGGAFSFAGAQSLSATDAGLPAGTAARSYGCWFKTTLIAGVGLYGWGTFPTADARQSITSSGAIACYSGADAVAGPFVCDGQWHFSVVTEDNAAGDGVRRKLYVDGRLVGASTVLTSLTLAGANRLRIGANPTGADPFTGQIDGAFVCGYALTFEQVAALYAKGSQALALSPKNAGDHVEAIDATNVLATFDMLDSTAQVDLGVAG